MVKQKYDRVYNFSAGPSILPLEVLEQVKEDLLNYKGTGQSVMEMSHRSKEYQKIIDEAEALEQFIGLRSDIEDMSLAQYFCELCLNLCPTGQEVKEQLRLALNSIYGAYEAPEMVFVPHIGKLYCLSCADQHGIQGVRLPIASITALRHTVYADFDKLFSFELKEELLEPLSLSSERYVAYMTHKDYPTLQFYKAML